MSHFIFGTFDSTIFPEINSLLVKQKLKRLDIKVMFNQELSFCNDLEQMIENNEGKDHYSFCITSTSQ